ncbi:MAG: LTA synthase family protein [Phycisphaerae bacterium]
MTERTTIAADESPHVQPARAGWLRCTFAGRRAWPVWATAGVVMLLFTACRVLLLSLRMDQFHGGWGEWARCVLIGMRYDLMPAGCITLPVALAMTIVPAGVLKRRAFACAVVLYMTLATLTVILVEMIGTPFFLHYGQRLNWMAIAYGQTIEIREHIRTVYPGWWLSIVAVIGVGLGLYVGFKWLLRGSFRGEETGRWARFRQALALTSLCIVACHGGVVWDPLSRDESYFTGNQLASQLTLNNFVTATDAARTIVGDLLDDYDQEIRKHRLPSVDRACEVTTEMLVGPSDIPTGAGTNPLWRRTETGLPMRRPNVVLIVMEGMSADPVGALGHRPTHTPNFDAIADGGLFFDRMYACGARTSRGMVGTLCGYPDLGGPSILSRDKAQGRFLTLPAIFQQRGYRTMFIYGGKSSFDNMEGFFTAGGERSHAVRGGIEEIIDQDEMGAEASIWGVPDEVIFRKAHERFLAAGERPFFATILTVSNHEPYQVPDRFPGRLGGDDEQTRMLNAYRYADWALGEFFRQAEGAPYFENTLFVLVADHGRSFDQTLAMDFPRNRVPCVFYGPALAEPVYPRRVSTVCSQTDLPVTLLTMLGGSFEHCFMGRDVLRVPEGEGFALLHEGDRLAYVRGRWAMVHRPGGRGLYYRTDGPSLEPVGALQMPMGRNLKLRNEMLSLYRMALYLYSEQAYSRPPMPVAASFGPAGTRLP